ncbi:MAG: hypothetical protein DRI75_12735 [Bacteroidetes bacterium]|nr:MAG: hypothetical protein DRI75_12735 [Bacteroidota bacterium]
MKKYNATFNLLFIIVLLGFTACNKDPKPPSFYSLGITSDSVIEKFEKYGFNFTSMDSVYQQPLTIGLSSDNNATIHLLGPKENLVNIKIVFRLSRQFNKSKLKLLRSYLDNMIIVVYPNWKEGNKWLEDNALSLSRSGSRTKILNDIKLTLVLSEKPMSMGLAFGDWIKLPKYDSENQSWKLNN